MPVWNWLLIFGCIGFLNPRKKCGKTSIQFDPIFLKCTSMGFLIFWKGKKKPQSCFFLWWQYLILSVLNWKPNCLLINFFCSIQVPFPPPWRWCRICQRRVQELCKHWVCLHLLPLHLTGHHNLIVTTIWTGKNQLSRLTNGHDSRTNRFQGCSERIFCTPYESYQDRVTISSCCITLIHLSKQSKWK